MKNELRFGSTKAALQHLANLTGKKVRVATDEEFEMLMQENPKDLAIELAEKTKQPGESVEDLIEQYLTWDQKSLVEEYLAQK